MKKKILSLIIVVMLFLSPFMMLLNVKAVDVTLNDYTVVLDNNNKITDVTYTEGGQTVHGGTITAYDVNTDYASDAYIYTTGHSDTFKAYKILDAYYDSTSNQFSYQFTTDFQGFLNDNAYASDATVHGLTVNQYLALTSDADGENGNATSSDVQHITTTASTLNVLVSKYASYIRSKEGTAGAIAGTAMTNGDYDTTNDYHDEADTRLSSVVPGSYLILPDSVTVREKDEDIFSKYIATYGVMVANVFFGRDENTGGWMLNDATIRSKVSMGQYLVLAYPTSIEALMSMTELEQMEYMTRAGMSTTTNSGDKILLAANVRQLDIPSNAHSSINSNVQEMLGKITIDTPTGITFDYTTTYDGEIRELTKSGNDFYRNGDLVIETNGNSEIIVYEEGATINLNISNSYAFTAGANNAITATTYYLKDPYVDIGSNVTAATVEAAFENAGGAGDTTQYTAIRKAIGREVQTVNIVLYGLRINNTNSSNASLSGGVFQAYSDSNCTAGNEIGGPVTMVNGTGSFVGISGYDTIYLKQITAPAGYRIIDTPIEVDPSELTLGQDSYYEITAVNQPMLALPFTGGSGTTIYVIIGLVVVAGAACCLILYKKKNKKI